MTYKFWKMCIESDTLRMTANTIGKIRLGLYGYRLYVDIVKFQSDAKDFGREEDMVDKVRERVLQSRY